MNWQALIRFTLIASCILASVTVYSQDWVYRLQPGDTLWGIAEGYLPNTGYAERLQTHNGIGDPRKLSVGAAVRVPVAWLEKIADTAEVIAVQGDVSVRVAGADRAQPVEMGMRVGAGATLKTGGDANVLLRFRDGTEYALRKNSTLLLRSLDTFGSTGMLDALMELQHGRVQGNVVPKNGPATRFQIDTPAAHTAVRGTVYRLNLDADSSYLRTEVLEGSVVVWSEGRFRTIESKTGNTVRSGEVPTAAQRLLVAPNLLAVPPGRHLLGRIDWLGVSGATNYRVQLARDSHFGDVVLDQLTDAASLELRGIPAGDYFLRVRGVNAEGLEGQDAVRRFQISGELPVQNCKDCGKSNY